MKKLFLVLCLLLIPSLVWAAPFLICDPAPIVDAVTRYVVILDATAPVDSVPVLNALRFDLAGVSAGPHSVKVKACNVWGCSADTAPFMFTKSSPGTPTTILIASP